MINELIAQTTQLLVTPELPITPELSVPPTQLPISRFMQKETIIKQLMKEGVSLETKRHEMGTFLSELQEYLDYSHNEMCLLFKISHQAYTGYLNQKNKPTDKTMGKMNTIMNNQFSTSPDPMLRNFLIQWDRIYLIYLMNEIVEPNKMDVRNALLLETRIRSGITTRKLSQLLNIPLNRVQLYERNTYRVPIEMFQKHYDTFKHSLTPEMDKLWIKVVNNLATDKGFRIRENKDWVKELSLLGDLEVIHPNDIRLQTLRRKMGEVVVIPENSQVVVEHEDRVEKWMNESGGYMRAKGRMCMRNMKYVNYDVSLV